MKVQNKKFSLIIYLSILSILIGCGSSGYQEVKGKDKSNASYKSPNLTDGFDVLPPEDEDTGGEVIPPPTTPPVGLKEPVIEQEVRAIGYTSTSIVVSAREVLKIQFEPMPQDRSVASTGYSPLYSKLAVYIEVNREQKPTPLLRNGTLGSLQRSNTIDMSAYIPKTCPASDADCRENVTVKITRPNYDYWCYNFGMPYCQQTHTYVYQTHPWAGIVFIQTDDTDELE